MSDVELNSTSSAPDPEHELEARREIIREGIASGSSDVLESWIDYLVEYQKQHPDEDEITAVDSFEEITQVFTRGEAEQYAQLVLDGDASRLAQPTEQNVDSREDPVTLFDGQFIHQATDMELDGAGVSFHFERTYRNQANASGPLGANWDHCYNLRLRVVGDVIARTTGELRDELFVRHPLFGQAGFSYWTPPPGVCATISQDNAGSFVYCTPGGARHHYEQDPSITTEHRIRRIEDRFGNYLNFAYSGGLLATVEVNHGRRIVRFAYDDFDRIAEVRDYTTDPIPEGRAWSYQYDDLGDLVAVTTPPTNQYRDGLTTLYEYSSSFMPAPLQHNLIRVIDPEGQIYLENEYGSDAGLLTFNRVVRQRQGNGVTQFEYEEVVQEFDAAYSDAERPIRITRMVARNGHVTTNIYNNSGNLLRKEEVVLLGGSVKVLQWTYRYNSDGEIIGTVTPDGAITQTLYVRDLFLRQQGIADEEARGHAQLTESLQRRFGDSLVNVRRGRRLRLYPSGLAQGEWGNNFPDFFSTPDPSDIIMKSSYEPDYGQLLTRSDPRFTQSTDPADTAPPREHAKFASTLTSFEYTGPAGDPHRLLARIRFANATLPDGTVQTGITREYPTYGSKGRLLRTIDPTGIATDNVYFDATAGVREGYLRSTTIDPNGVVVTQSYEVNERGLVTRMISPKGQTALGNLFSTRITSNSVDDVISIRNSPPFDDEIRYGYDRNRQRIAIEWDLRDESGLPIDGGIELRTFAYDSQFNVLEESVGGADRSQHRRVRHRYNSSDKLVRTVHPTGTETWCGYDARLFLTSVTRAACTPLASTVRMEYEPDGSQKRVIDPRGFATDRQKDAFGRVVAVTDPLGVVHRTDYDKSSNIILERIFEPDGTGDYRMLSRTEHVYDELNRRVIERRCLFNAPLPAIDPAIAYLAPGGPWMTLETLFFFDKSGRVVKRRDATGAETTTIYDPRGMSAVETDAVGVATRSTYDANGNLTRRDVHEPVVDAATGAVVGEEVFSAVQTYDELDRLTSVSNTLGNTTRYAYDSRDRVVVQTDPLGNITRHAYDVFGQCIAKTFERTKTGLAGGAQLPPFVTKFEYDADGNRTAIIDPRGNKTVETFNVLGCRTARTFADGTVERFEHDSSGNIVTYRDGNGLIRTHTIDAVNRVTNVVIDASSIDASASVVGTTSELFSFDGLGRTIVSVTDDVTLQRAYDSLDRCVSETRRLHVNQPGIVWQSNRTIVRGYDPLGRLTRLQYPNGRVIGYEPDAVGRPVRIWHVATGTGYPGSPPAPTPSLLVQQTYTGRRLKVSRFKNGWSIANDFDQAGRVVARRYGTSGPPPEVMEIQQLHDAAARLRLKNEFRTGGQVGEKFFYDSLGRLTYIASASLARFDPARLAPRGFPLPASTFNGQATIDSIIGALQDDPAQFTYRYDSAGNRQAANTSAGTVQYVANTVDQYTSIDGTAWAHDHAGNLRSNSRMLYSYDFRNRLTRVDDAATGVTIRRFFYDADGRRALSYQSGAAIEFVQNGANVIEEYQSGNLVAAYVHEYAPDTLCQMAASGCDYYILRDQVRSTRLITDDNGAVTARYRFAPFGETLEDSSFANAYKFSGRRLDSATGSYDFRTRELVPAAGRFLQRDGASSPNLYALLENNPLTAIDPSGAIRQPLQLRMDLFDGDGSAYPPAPPQYTLTEDLELKLDPKAMSLPIDRTRWSKGLGNFVLGGGELAGGGAALAVATAATGGGAGVLFGIAAALGLSTGLIQSSEGLVQWCTADKRSAERDIAINEGMAQMALIMGSWGGLMGATYGGIISGDSKGAMTGALVGNIGELAFHLGAGGFAAVNTPAAFGKTTASVAEMESRFSKLSRARGLSQSSGWGRGRRNAIFSLYGYADAASRTRPNPLFAKGVEQLTVSHFIARGVLGGRIEAILNHPWNLKLLWNSEHALCDPEHFAAMGANKAFQQANKANQLSGLGKWSLRTPDWIKVAGAQLPGPAAAEAALTTSRSLQLTLLWE
jgi:RHS repeat-associated protein